MLEYDEMSTEPPVWYPAIEDFLKHERLEEAKRAAEEVVAKCRKAGDDRATALALRGLAVAQLWARDDDEQPIDAGLAAVKEALALSRAAKDDPGEAAALHLKSKFHMSDKHIDECMRDAQEALAKTRALPDRTAEAYVVNTVARVHHIRGELEEAMRLTQDCLGIFEELDNVRGRISVLQTLYRLHMSNGDRWQTIIVMDELVELHGRIGDSVGEGTAGVLAAQYHMDCGNPQHALSLAQRGAATFKREGLSKKRGSALLCSAAASVALGDIATGRATAKEAGEVLKGIGDLGGQAAAACVLANAHRTLCEFRKAANRFEEAAMLYGQEGDKTAKANSMREVASCLVKMLLNTPEVPDDGWPPESMAEPLRAAKASASLFQQMRDTESEAYGFTLQQLSNCHLINHELPEAISRGNESLRIFERTGNHQGAASAHGSIAQAVALKGDNSEALRLAKKGLELAKRANDQEHIQFHTRLINEYGPAAAKEQEPAEKKASTGASGEGASDNCAYHNGNPFVTYESFQPRIAKAPPREQPKEPGAPGRAPKKEKAEVIYTTRWVKGPAARAEAKPETLASRRMQKEVRAMGPAKGGRMVLPVGEAGLAGFEPGDFEPDDAESWRRPSPTDGYHERIIASTGEL